MSASAETNSRFARTGPPGGEAQWQLLSRAFARLDPVALGIATGAVSGCILWLLTVSLILKGGVWVGMHLGRLAFFLPGYTVSFAGAFIGAAEAALAGFVVGVLLAMIWNVYHRLFVAFVVMRERRRAMRRELEEF